MQADRESVSAYALFQDAMLRLAANPYRDKFSSGTVLERQRLQTLDDEKAKLEAFAQRVKGSHEWRGSVDMVAGADNTVTTTIVEKRDGELTVGQSKPFSCEIKSTVLSISAGSLFSTIPSRDYVSVQVPKVDAKGNTLNESYNALSVKNSSNLSPFALAMLNYDLPIPRLSSNAFGLIVSSGPTFRIGGAPGNTSSFGYFGGVGVHLWKRFFVTPGIHVGQIADFPVGYSQNSAIPGGATPVPVTRWIARFAVSRSYWTNSIATLGQRSATPTAAPGQGSDAGKPAPDPKPPAAVNKPPNVTPAPGTDPISQPGATPTPPVAPLPAVTAQAVPPPKVMPAAMASAVLAPPPAAAAQIMASVLPAPMSMQSQPYNSPTRVSFTGSAQFDGAACPAEPALKQAFAFTPDGTALSVLFDSFALSTSAVAEVGTNCSIRLALRIPAGQRVAIGGADVRAVRQGVAS